MNVAQLLQELQGKTNLTLVILTVALLLCRILPLIVLSPVLGGEVVPTQVKIGLGVTMAIVMFPAVAPRMGNIPVGAVAYVCLMLKELFIGVALAFVTDAVFQAAHVAGTFVDTMSGASMAQVMVPQMKENVTLFSSLNMQLAVVLFLTLDGHHLVIGALADSFKTIPLDQFPKFSHGMWPFFDQIMKVFAMMFEVGLAIAAPTFIATFLTDLALGMINRVAPQVQVYFISMQIKPVVVITIALLSLHVLLSRMHGDFSHTMTALKEALRLLT
jgi:flagellar biosynthetic protein FliR